MKTPPTSSLSGPPCSIEASPLPPIEKGDSDWRTYNAINYIRTLTALCQHAELMHACIHQHPVV